MNSNLILSQIVIHVLPFLSQVWISWSFCKATRTQKSTRKPLILLSVTSAAKTRTPPWLRPSTCSSSSSSSSSARLRWKASSYNASWVRPSFSPLLILCHSAHCHDQGFRQPAATFFSLVIVGEINITSWFTEDVTSQEHTCPTWVKFYSLVSQFVKVSLIPSRVRTPSPFSRPQHYPNDRLNLWPPFMTVWNPFYAPPRISSSSVFL